MGSSTVGLPGFDIARGSPAPNRASPGGSHVPWESCRNTSGRQLCSKHVFLIFNFFSFFPSPGKFHFFESLRSSNNDYK